ncbi:MAG TPA: MFS transporter [Actinomycetota bacterium]
MGGRGEPSPQSEVSIGRVLFQRNFFPYFLGNLISNSGTWFQSVAQVLFVYRLTGSLFMVGVVNFAQFAGMLIVTPVGGSYADRFDRRKLLIRVNLATAALAGLLALLTAMDLITLPILFTLVLLIGTAVALITPTMQALISALVPRHQLPKAIAMNGVTFQTARVLGPILGALVVDRFGFAWAFSVNALSFVALAASVWAVHPITPQARAKGRPPMWEGLRVAREDRALAAVLSVGIAVSFAMDPLITTGAEFATEEFGRADTLVGLLIAVYGAGAIVAAFTRSWEESTSPRRVGASVSMIAAGMVAFSLAPTLAVALPVLFIAGYGHLSSTAASLATVQLAVPDEMRGRIMALWTITFLGMRPLASLLDGTLASVAGVRWAAAAMSVPAVLVAMLLFSTNRGTREDG